ncbi:hypothetical protein HDU76_006983, partial [Blyttiomyces sp. JEL0837]
MISAHILLATVFTLHQVAVALPIPVAAPDLICLFPPCPTGSTCSKNGDCSSGVCLNGYCTSADSQGVTTSVVTTGGSSSGGSGGLTPGTGGKITFMGWEMWDTDTGNEPCAQDIGYQMTSQNENGGNNLITSGNGLEYCIALDDMSRNGCTMGFVGINGGGGALLLWAYYSKFNGTSDTLRKYYIPGDTSKIKGSKISKAFCNAFCKDFKQAVAEDREKMVYAQSYGNAIMNGIPTKQIAAILHLKLPLSYAAV